MKPVEPQLSLTSQADAYKVNILYGTANKADMSVFFWVCPFSSLSCTELVQEEKSNSPCKLSVTGGRENERQRTGMEVRSKKKTVEREQEEEEKR